MDFDAETVLELARGGEGREVEFKRGLPGPAKTARTLVAFANTRGGVLLVGVTDHGRPYGVRQPRRVVSALRDYARERAEPPVPLHVQAVRVEDPSGAPEPLWIVACSVPLSPERPHELVHEDGRRELVVRAGSSNRRASGATLAALRRSHRRGPGSPLERQVLAWIGPAASEGGATVARFARANNIGLQRARRAFVELERAGRLVAHGAGARRTYELA